MSGVGGMSTSHLLLDKSHNRVARHGPYSIYVDNFLVFSTDASLVRATVADADQRLQGAGLPTHEVESCATSAEVLGWFFDGVQGILRPTRRRAWRVMRALDFLAARRYVQVRDLQKVLGHCTFLGMLRRESLAIVWEVYNLVGRSPNAVVRLNHRAKKELYMFRNVIPLFIRNLAAPWAEQVSCSDASPTGYGGVCKRFSIAKVKEAASFSERWRGKLGSASGARADWGLSSRSVPAGPEQAHREQLVEDATSDDWHEAGNPDLECLLLDSCFLDTGWSVFASHSWSDTPSMPEAESRAFAFAIKRLFHTHHNIGHRHLILGDSLTAIFAICKGRSSARGLAPQLRCIAAHLLGTGTYVYARFLPSEVNHADGPSRGSRWPSRPDPTVLAQIRARREGLRGGAPHSAPDGLEEFGDGFTDFTSYAGGPLVFLEGLPDVTDVHEGSGVHSAEEAAASRQEQVPVAEAACLHPSSGGGGARKGDQRRLLAEEGRARQHGDEVQRVSGGVRRLHLGQRLGDELPGGNGRVRDPLDGRPVRGWDRELPRLVHVGGHRVAGSPLQPLGSVEAPFRPADARRVEDVVPGPLSIAHARGAGGGASDACLRQALLGHGGRDPHEPHFLPPSRGGQSVARAPPDPAGAGRRPGAGPVVYRPPRTRVAGPLEDVGVRRDVALGPPQGRLVRSGVAEAQGRVTPRRFRVPGQKLRSGGSAARSWPRPLGGGGAVQDAAQRSVHRLQLGGPAPRGSSSSGALEMPSLGASLRERRQAHPSLGRPATGRSELLHRGGQGLAGRADRAQGREGVPRLLKVRYCIEVGCKVGRVLEALSERRFLGVLWDVSRGPAFDLCNRGVVSQLRGVITAGHVQAVICHLPFGTWQVPLARPKGPPVIRDIHDAHRCVSDDPITISRINRANHLVRVAVSVADSCRHQQVPFFTIAPGRVSGLAVASH